MAPTVYECNQCHRPETAERVVFKHGIPACEACHDGQVIARSGANARHYWHCVLCGAKGYEPNIALCYAHRDDDFSPCVPRLWKE